MKQLRRLLDWLLESFVAALAWCARATIGRRRADTLDGQPLDSPRRQLVIYVAVVAPTLALAVLVPAAWPVVFVPFAVAACVGAMWLHEVERMRCAIRSQAEPELRHNLVDPLYQRIGLVNLAVGALAIFPALVYALSHQSPELRTLFEGGTLAGQYWAALGYSIPDLTPGGVEVSGVAAYVLTIARGAWTLLLFGAWKAAGDAQRILDSLEDIGRHNPNLAAALAWSNGGEWAVNQGKHLVARAYGRRERHDDDPKTEGKGDARVFLVTALEIAERDNSTRSLALLAEVAANEVHRLKIKRRARKTILDQVADAFARWSRHNAAAIRSNTREVDACAHGLLRAYVDGGARVDDEIKAHFGDRSNFEWLAATVAALRTVGLDPATALPDAASYLRERGIMLADLAPAPTPEPVAAAT